MISTTRPAFLVVTADDAGTHLNTDGAILNASDTGCVTSASVLVTGPTAFSFVSRALQLGLGLGLHFDLTDGPPLSEEGRVLALQGAFTGDKHRVWEAASEFRFDSALIAAEAYAQWRRLEDLGVNPDHLNSHNHVHMYPSVLEGLLLGIPDGMDMFLRVSEELECPEDLRPALPVQFLRGSQINAQVAGVGWKTPDRFVGLRFSAEPKWESLSHLRDVRPGVTEWMIHPGRRPTSSFTRDFRRDDEACLVSDIESRRRLVSWGYTLTAFGDLL